jgi:hypothetical protein
LRQLAGATEGTLSRRAHKHRWRASSKHARRSKSAPNSTAAPTIREGLEPETVGDLVVDGIRDNAAYIYTHD